MLPPGPTSTAWLLATRLRSGGKRHMAHGGHREQACYTPSEHHSVHDFRPLSQRTEQGVGRHLDASLAFSCLKSVVVSHGIVR